jgi:hypothetical protein
MVEYFQSKHRVAKKLMFVFKSSKSDQVNLKQGLIYYRRRLGIAVDVGVLRE